MKNDKTFTVKEPTQLLPFLIEKHPKVGRNKIKSLLTHRQVMVEDRVVTRHDHALEPGQHVIVRATGGAAKESMSGVQILFEDAHLLVVDKPPGLLSVATDAEKEHTTYRVLMDHVRRSDPASRVFIVHRLDRETSGVMMFAKSEAVQQAMQNAWKDAVLERAYVVVVEGRVTEPEGKISTWLKESKTQKMYVSRPGDGLKSVTNYKVLDATDEFSLLEVHLDTGRKNQIRVHMEHIGHSVVGDKRYGSTKNPIDRLGLHARVLSFRHPVTNEVLRFETPIPNRFRILFPKKRG